MLRRLDPDGVLHDGATADPALVTRLLHDMARSRAFDRAALKLARRGRIKGYYPSIGQEALAAIAPHLGTADLVVPAYREQPLRLAMGIDPAEELAMWAGAPGAPWDPIARRCLPANTSIGAHVPHAVGWADAQRRLGTGGIAVAVFGDGATSEGDVHAAMTLAGVWQAPVVLVCQNNQYAQTTAVGEQTAAPTLAMKAFGYGIPGVRVDGMDPLAVHDAFAEAAARARAGDGPTFLELVTYRFAGHSSFEVAPAYRDRAEEARWRALDPLRRTAALLTALGGDPAAVVREAEAGMAGTLDDALDAIAERPLPTQEELVAWSAAAIDPLPAVAPPPSADTPVAAIAAALHERMAADERIVVLGEDVVSTGGIWGATTGLAESFGDRVVDTPLTEQGIVGAAIGMALAGLHPVVEIQFGGFVLTAIDQWQGHAARYAARSGGRLRVPLVLRMPAGAGHGGYEGHNESFDLLHVSAPGVQVCAPSTPREAYALTRRALATQGPVVVLEPTADYLRDAWGSDADGRSLAADDGRVPSWGSSALRTRGDAATVVAYGSSVRIADEAAALLADDGITVDLLDLHDLMAWDIDAVLASVRRTGRLVIVQDAPPRGGLGASIISAVAERDPHLFAVPPVRVAQPDVPYGPALLEPVTAISADAVVEAVWGVIG